MPKWAKDTCQKQRVNDDRKWIPEFFRGHPPDPIIGTLRIDAAVPGYLGLEGIFEGVSVSATLRRDEMKFLLFEHGFHWIHDWLFWPR